MNRRVNRRYQLSEDEIKAAIMSWLVFQDHPGPPTLDDISIERQDHSGETLAFVVWEVEDEL